VGKAEENEKRTAEGKVRRRRRKSGRGFYYILAGFLAVVAIVVCSNIFFEVEYIEIEGLTKYAPQLIIDNCGIYSGDKLFRVNGEKVEEGLVEQFAYIENVRLGYKIPSTIILKIEQCEPAAYFRGADGHILISSDGRTLETGVDKPPAGVIEVDGLGEMPDEKETGFEAYTEKLNVFNNILQALNENKISGVNFIDLTDLYDIAVMYRNRVAIDISNESQLDYKMAMVKKVIDDAVGSTGMYYINATSPGMTSVRPVDSINEFFNSPIYAVTEDELHDVPQEESGDENAESGADGGEESGADENAADESAADESTAEE